MRPKSSHCGGNQGISVRFVVCLTIRDSPTSPLSFAGIIAEPLEQIEFKRPEWGRSPCRYGSSGRSRRMYQVPSSSRLRTLYRLSMKGTTPATSSRSDGRCPAIPSSAAGATRT
jgi:hypothetical protein